MKWFGFKKRTDPSDLYEMAQRLHLERRLHPRVRLPLSADKFRGPRVHFDNRSFPIFDLSEGGVCLLDPDDHLRSHVGRTIQLEFQCGGTFLVDAKVVASNLNRRHIQFSQPPAELIQHMRPWIAVGLRGLWMKNMTIAPAQARYKIFLGSILEDSLISSTDLRWELDLFLMSKAYCLSLSSWPTRRNGGKRVSAEEFDHILMFLSNVDNRHLPAQEELIKKLEELRAHDEN